MTESEKYHCDECKEEVDLKHIRYFPKDTNICLYCINPGFQSIRELRKCQSSFNELNDKYNILLEFVKKIPELHDILNYDELYLLGEEASELLKGNRYD